MYLPLFALTRRHGALAALALGVIAAACGPIYSEWQESEFRTLTPMQHYGLALRLLYPRTQKLYSTGNDVISRPWIAEPSTSDLKAAIHHLEAIPTGVSFGQGATELLPLLRLKRDRPQDFLSMEQARYLSCMASIRAKRAELLEQVARERPCRHLLTSDGRCITAFCGTGLDEECAPLAGSERLAQLRALLQERP
jgi:hypothetical protein